MGVDHMRKRYVAELFPRVCLVQGQPHPHLQGRGPGGAQVPLLRQQDQRARLQRYVGAPDQQQHLRIHPVSLREMT